MSLTRCLRATHCRSLLMRKCTLRYLPAKIVGRFHVLGKCPTVCVRPALCEACNVVSDPEVGSVQLRNFVSELHDMAGPVAAADGTRVRDIVDVCAWYERISSTEDGMRHTLPVSWVLSDRNDLNEDFPFVDLWNGYFPDLHCFIGLRDQSPHRLGDRCCHGAVP